MIAIIDYGMGNLKSVANTLDYLGYEYIITNSEESIKEAEKLILPGVGAFNLAMQNLIRLNLINILNIEVITNNKPILGICLGMQLMAIDSTEYGHTKGLGWLNGNVIEFDLKDKNLKVPHMGWNEIKLKKNDSKLFNRISDNTNFYFVHSYHFVTNDVNIIEATCNYGYEFVCAVSNDNIFATQFHPEKSQDNGLDVISNFLKL